MASGPTQASRSPGPAAPPAQMGAQKGGRAGLFLAKAGAEVTQVQLRAGVGWITDIPEGSSQKEAENPGSGTPSSCSDKKQEGGLTKAGTAAHSTWVLGKNVARGSLCNRVACHFLKYYRGFLSKVLYLQWR